MKRDPIDFHAVRPIHQEIHLRLLNWARWTRPGRGGGNTLPMFQGYRPDGYHEIFAPMPIDTLDAVSLQKLFSKLPEKNRWAIQWAYCYTRIYEGKVCRYLGVNRVGLSELIHDGRAMLKNRGAQ